MEDPDYETPIPSMRRRVSEKMASWWTRRRKGFVRHERSRSAEWNRVGEYGQVPEEKESLTIVDVDKQIDVDYLAKLFQMCTDALDKEDPGHVAWKPGRRSDGRGLLEEIGRKDAILEGIKAELQIAECPSVGLCRISPRKKRLTEVRDLPPQLLFSYAAELINSIEPAILSP